MGKEVLDKIRFAAAVRAKRGKVGLRDAAAQIEETSGKISPATLSRVEQGKAPDVDTFLRLCSWLETSPTEFAGHPNQACEPKQKPTVEAIEAQLRADNVLSEDTTNALVEMIRLAYGQHKPK
jgi:transcriptional regulator with XRE-family HTH domain